MYRDIEETHFATNVIDVLERTIKPDKMTKIDLKHAKKDAQNIYKKSKLLLEKLQLEPEEESKNSLIEEEREMALKQIEDLEIERKNMLEKIEDLEEENLQKFKDYNENKQQSIKNSREKSKQKIRDLEEENKQKIENLEEERQQRIKSLKEKNKQKIESLEEENQKRIQDLDEKSKQKIRSLEEENQKRIKDLDEKNQQKLKDFEKNKQKAISKLEKQQKEILDLRLVLNLKNNNQDLVDKLKIFRRECDELEKTRMEFTREKKQIKTKIDEDKKSIESLAEKKYNLMRKLAQEREDLKNLTSSLATKENYRKEVKRNEDLEKKLIEMQEKNKILEIKIEKLKMEQEEKVDLALLNGSKKGKIIIDSFSNIIRTALRYKASEGGLVPMPPTLVPSCYNDLVFHNETTTSFSNLVRNIYVTWEGRTKRVNENIDTIVSNKNLIEKFNSHMILWGVKNNGVVRNIFKEFVMVFLRNMFRLNEEILVEECNKIMNYIINIVQEKNIKP